MTWLASTLASFRLSQLTFYKRIGFALIGIALPISLCVFMTQGGTRKPEVQGLPYDVYVFTGYVGFSLFFITFNLVTAVVARREALIYKRLRTTPLPASSILWGESISATISALITVAALLCYGIGFLRVGVPANPLLFFVAVVLGAIMFSLIGFGLSGLAPTSDVAVWVVTPIVLAFMSGSGIFWPLATLPFGLGSIAAFSPVSPLVAVIRTAYAGKDYTAVVPREVVLTLGQGFAVSVVPLIVMVAWILIGVLMFRFLFRWDPRRR